jgi:hypothetical protein
MRHTSVLRAFLDTMGDGPLAERLLIVEPGGKGREYRPIEP